MSIETIGVVGAGQMGAGIAQVFARAGFKVVLNDIAPERIEAGMGHIRKGLGRLVAKAALSEADAEAALAQISAASLHSQMAGCDAVIEAAPEQEQIKRDIFASLVPVLRRDAIVATNTSSLSITRLSRAVPAPERFIGLHFMNPVPVMALVEIIPGLATSEATRSAMLTLVEKLGKRGIVSADRPGFVVNRLLIPMINEAVFALSENLASAEDIDAAMLLGANMPLGPLKLADLIGLDTCLAIMRVLHAELGEDKYRPSPLLAQYVDAGWLGRKSGRGFFVYPQ